VGFRDFTHYELYSSDAQLLTPYRAFMHPESVMTNHTGDSPSFSGICERVNQRVERAIVERREKASTMDKSMDQERGKGATEQDSQNEGGNTSMQGQLCHHDEDAELKNADSDLSGRDRPCTAPLH
jgi:hypothetical protein